jgi:hypothetical protein
MSTSVKVDRIVAEIAARQAELEYRLAHGGSYSEVKDAREYVEAGREWLAEVLEEEAEEAREEARREAEWEADQAEEARLAAELEEELEAEREWEAEQEAEAEYTYAMGEIERTRPEGEPGHFATCDWLQYAKLCREWDAGDPDLLDRFKAWDAEDRTAPASADTVWMDQIAGFQDDRFWAGWTREELLSACAVASNLLGFSVRSASADIRDAWIEEDGTAAEYLEGVYRGLHTSAAEAGLDWEPDRYWGHQTALFTWF